MVKTRICAIKVCQLYCTSFELTSFLHTLKHINFNCSCVYCVCMFSFALLFILISVSFPLMLNSLSKEMLNCQMMRQNSCKTLIGGKCDYPLS